MTLNYGILKWYGFGLTAILRGFELYECLLVFVAFLIVVVRGLLAGTLPQRTPGAGNSST